MLFRPLMEFHSWIARRGKCNIERLGLFALIVLIFSFAFREPQNGIAFANRDETAADENSDTYVERANKAIQALQSGLLETLTNKIKEGGLGSAVFVCRDEARNIAARVAKEGNIAVGRTSHRLRNPQNTPPSWAENIVRQAAGRKTHEVKSHVFDMGDTIGILRPISTLGLCTNCHGNPAEIEGEVRQALKNSYPKDQAIGFSVGDLRGWMWAEVAK